MNNFYARIPPEISARQQLETTAQVLRVYARPQECVRLPLPQEIAWARASRAWSSACRLLSKRR